MRVSFQLAKTYGAGFAPYARAIANCIYRANGGNGRPAVEFDGSTSYARSPSFTRAQPLRVYVVGKRSATANGRFFDGNTLNRATLQASLANGLPILGLYAGAGQTNWEQTLDLGYPSLIDSLFNGASSALRVNENNAASPNSPGATGFNDGIILGAAGGLNAGFFLTGQIQALVVCDDSALSAGDRSAIRAYLTAKYGCVTRSVLVTDGNSLTAGNGSTNAALYSFPAQLQALLGGAAKWRLNNLGVGGQTTQQMTADAAADVDAKQAQFAKRILIAQEMGNDIKINGLTGAQAYANFQAYCQARQAAGWGGGATNKLIVLTASVRQDMSAGEAVALVAANNLLRAGYASFADILVDIAADSRFSDASNTTYFADGTHYTDAGYAAEAGLIYSAISAAGLA